MLVPNTIARVTPLSAVEQPLLVRLFEGIKPARRAAIIASPSRKKKNSRITVIAIPSMELKAPRKNEPPTMRRASRISRVPCRIQPLHLLGRKRGVRLQPQIEMRDQRKLLQIGVSLDVEPACRRLALSAAAPKSARRTRSTARSAATAHDRRQDRQQSGASPGPGNRRRKRRFKGNSKNARKAAHAIGPANGQENPAISA
jgi:hypothetical protein